MVAFHTRKPRHDPDRYVMLTQKQHRTKAGWWDVTLTTHDGDAEIVVETMDEAMTLEGAKSRAAELAQSKAIQDVIICEGKA